MKISAQMTVVMAAIFAVICFSVVGFVLSGVGQMTDPAQIADARGFAMFWAFLGFVAAVMCAISVWMVRTRKDGEDI